jgi:hypothetical protein
MRGRVYVLVISVVLAVFGCGSESGSEPRPRPWSNTELGASFIQFRPDEGTLHVAVSVTNKTRRTIDVTGVALRWSGVRNQPITPQDGGEVIPGTTVSFFIDLAGLSCGGGHERPKAYVVASGRRAILPIDKVGEGLLRDLWRRGCADDAVRAVADISLGRTWRAAGPTATAGLRGTLVMTRHRTAGGQPGPLVTITSMTGSVLLDLVPVVHRHPFGVLLPTQNSRAIPVIIRSNRRCDQHALGQSTQTFLLRVGVTTGKTSTLIIVTPDRALRQQIGRNISTACKIENH